MSRAKSSLRQIEADFHAAINRLEEGRPRHHKLAAMAKAGTLKVNATTVALEAGRSRTLIALETCRLPRIRERLRKREVGKGGGTQPGRFNEIARLRGEVQRLQGELAQALSWQKKYYLDALRAQRESEKWKGALQLLQNSTDHVATVTVLGARGKRR